MKILHVNTIDTGGAAIAAIRLHYLLLENGIDSKILFLKKTGNKTIKEAYYFEDLFKFHFLFYLKEKFNNAYNRRFTFYKPSIYFNGPDSLFDISKHHLFRWADVVHLHWVVKFLDWQKVFSHKSKSYVWTLHDMNPMTGGEHYQTGYHHEFSDTARKNILKKKEAVKALKLTIITPSYWLMNLAKNSEIFGNTPVKNIKNPLDTNTFSLKDKTTFKNKYGLPTDRKTILFVAENPDDRRKGYRYLIRSIEKTMVKDHLHMAIIGKKSFAHALVNATFFGTINNEDTLSELYNSADVFVIPSLEDNLPNTVSEALLCGTPVAGFKTGGIPDMVKDGLNGYLAADYEALDQVITECIKHDFDRLKIRDTAYNSLNPSLLLDEFLKIYQQ